MIGRYEIDIECRDIGTSRAEADCEVTAWQSDIGKCRIWYSRSMVLQIEPLYDRSIFCDPLHYEIIDVLVILDSDREIEGRAWLAEYKCFTEASFRISSRMSIDFFEIFCIIIYILPLKRSSQGRKNTSSHKEQDNQEEKNRDFLHYFEKRDKIRILPLLA